jgi:hypothetical protein
VKCLKEKEAEVSAACKEHREKMKGAMKEAHAACEDDVATLCSGVEKGKGRVMKCLKENKEKVSESCKASFAGMKNLRKGK